MNVGVYLIYRRRRQKIERVSHLTNDKEGFVLAKTLGLMILVLGRDLPAWSRWIIAGLSQVVYDQSAAWPYNQVHQQLKLNSNQAIQIRSWTGNDRLESEISVISSLYNSIVWNSYEFNIYGECQSICELCGVLYFNAQFSIEQSHLCLQVKPLSWFYRLF